MKTFSGKEYLAIDIANQMGYDKWLFEDRIAWVMDNDTVLESLAMQADQPVMYRKAVRAWRTVNKGEPTNHIMGLDATASGLQMLACLSGCRQTAEEVNLVDPGVRKDVYTDLTQDMSNSLGKSIPRADFKQAVMTTFYGSTAVPESVFGKKTEALRAFYHTLMEALPGAYELMVLFQNQWNPEATHYQWSMPDGHVVRIPVLDVEDKKIEVDEMDHLTFTYRTSIIKPQKQGRSLAANITHSVDAWVLREMIRRTHALGIQVAPIHDCYYTSPRYMNEVRRIYVEVLSELVTRNLVPGILEQITGKKISFNHRGNALALLVLSSEYALC